MNNTDLYITEHEHDVADNLLKQEALQQLRLEENDAYALHTVITAYKKHKPVKEDLGNALYQIARKYGRK
jgi:hypothetical protein